MDDHGLLEAPKDKIQDKLFIEYGAGRAGLSSFVAEKLLSNGAQTDQFKFVIVDRDTRRHKLDKNIRDDYLTLREKMDIADFNLQKFIETNQMQKKVREEAEIICIAKHLCGGATDLSITSILDRQSVCPITGVSIATCCHHQCDMKTFCNLSFIKEKFLDLKDAEIKLLPRFTSWAITQNPHTG